MSTIKVNREGPTTTTLSIPVVVEGQLKQMIVDQIVKNLESDPNITVEKAIHFMLDSGIATWNVENLKPFMESVAGYAFVNPPVALELDHYFVIISGMDAVYVSKP